MKLPEYMAIAGLKTGMARSEQSAKRSIQQMNEARLMGIRINPKPLALSHRKK